MEAQKDTAVFQQCCLVKSLCTPEKICSCNVLIGKRFYNNVFVCCNLRFWGYGHTIASNWIWSVLSFCSLTCDVMIDLVCTFSFHQCEVKCFYLVHNSVLHIIFVVYRLLHQTIFNGFFLNCPLFFIAVVCTLLTVSYPDFKTF